MDVVAKSSNLPFSSWLGANGGNGNVERGTRVFAVV